MTKEITPFSFFSLKSSFVFATALFVIGLILQLFFGEIPIDKLKFPINLYLFIELFFITIALWVLFKKKKLVRWLASSNSTISAISLFAFMVTIMAIIPQGKTDDRIIESFGLNSIIFSWMYSLSVTFLLISLGLVTLRRFLPFKGRNIAFFTNHFGLWLAMSTSILGFADKQQLVMSVNLNQLVWYAQNESKDIIELPFALKLEKFTVKYHPPKIALINKDGQPFKVSGDQLKEINGKGTLIISGNKIEVLEYFENAYFNGDSVLNVPGVAGTTIAAKVRIQKDSLIEGWISSENHMFPGSYLFLHPDTVLCLLSPEPAYYGSEVLLFTKSGIDGEKNIISVNKPLNAEGWTIYQYSYDARLGNDSLYSVFSIIKDPWLPYVYVGIFLMMIGGIWLIFAKIKTKPTNPTEL